MAGGALGTYIGLKITHSSMERDEFWQEALECYNGISSLELSGALLEA